MKNMLVILVCCLVAFATLAGVTLTAHAQDAKKTEEPVELIVFAAASMTETLTKLGEMYNGTPPPLNGCRALGGGGAPGKGKEV